MKLWKWTWFLGVLLAAVPAWADDEGWSNTITNAAGIQRGGLRLVWSGVICNNYSAAAAVGSETCMVDFGSLKTKGQGDLIVFFAPNEDGGFDCTSGACVRQATVGGDCGNATTFELNTGFQRTASPATTSPTGSIRRVATTSTLVTNSRDTNWLALNTRYTPLDRYLFIAVTTLGVGCTTNDLIMSIYDDTDT